LGDIQAADRLLLIDFGLAKQYRDALGNHDALTVTPNLFSGTPIYASMWSHDGMSSSRRSDLESLGYTMLQLCLENGLPWANLPNDSRKKLKTIRAEIYDCKKRHSIASMCRSLPLPVARAFCNYFKSVRSLGHAERPDCKPLPWNENLPVILHHTC
jgi:serine/threonine protein kinase